LRWARVMTTKSELIVEHSTLALLVVDSQRKILFLNQAAEELLQISVNRALGSLFTDLVALEYDDDHNTLVRQITLERFGEESILVDCTTIPNSRIDSNGEVIIQLQRVDQQLRLLREEQLIEQSNASEEMLQGLAHEIKNPLGGLRGAAQLLERELTDDNLKEYTNIIISEADRLQRLLDRMAGPKDAPKMEPTNIHQLLERAATLILNDDVNGKASGNRVEIERDYDPSIPLLYADGDQLIQALLNIVRNAAQSMNYLGVITVRTRIRNGTFCAVEIEDCGPGIPDELQMSIFLPMVTTRAEGRGLGLSISQSIIQHHNGILECSSQPGKTLFTILIPLEDHNE